MLLVGCSIIPCSRVYAANNAHEAIEEHKKLLIAHSRKTGVWASVTAAQMIQECANPFGSLERDGHNYFGIKWADSFAEKYPGAVPEGYMTGEHFNGKDETIHAKFAHFPSPEASFAEHSVIWWNGCYAPEVKILEDLNSTMEDFLKEVGNGPYATDPNYYTALKNNIRDFNLEELDKLAFPDGRKCAGVGDKIVGEYAYPDDGYNADDIENSPTDTKTDPETGETILIVSEEDLAGMLPKPTYLEDYEEVTLPNYDDLSVNEKTNIDKIKENIKLASSWNLWDNLRVVVVFSGLCILVYAVMFIVGYLFDRSNNIIEISLVNVITLGSLEYTSEDVALKGYVNRKRLIRIEVALFLVGFFLVSGSLFSFIIDVIWYSRNLLGY